MLENLKTRLRDNTLAYGDLETWGLLAYLPIRIKGDLACLRYVAQSLRFRREADYIHRHPEDWRHKHACNAYPVPKSGLIFWLKVLEGAYRLTKVRLGFLPPH